VSSLFAERLKEAAEVATPTPWQVVATDGKLWLLGPAMTDELAADFLQGTLQPHPAGQPRDRDTALIVLLRNATPEIVAVLEAARAVCEAIENEGVTSGEAGLLGHALNLLDAKVSEVTPV
jgi:hypothetical protein